MIIVTHGATEAEISRPWKLTVLVTSLLAVGALSWGYSQARRAERLEEAIEVSRGELVQARAAVRQAEKRELPVSVSYSLSSGGLVALVKSDFPRQLEIVAMCSDSINGQRKRFNLTLPARGQVQIGQAEGWDVVPGSRIVLYNGAFRQAEYVVPDL
jgi:hypothetical protein